MAVWERQTQNFPYKEPSFSSSLLDAIYRSIDEKRGENEQHEPEDYYYIHQRTKNAAQRSIMIEKWIEKNYHSTTNISTPRHLPSNSSSSTDSSVFSSTETESSASKSKIAQTPPTEKPIKIFQILETNTKHDTNTRFTRTKSKNGQKAKEPISPGGKIANFLNSIFSPRNSKRNHLHSLQKLSSVRKSRSVNDAKTCSFATRSCLSKNNSSKGNANNNNIDDHNKSKRCVRFVDQDFVSPSWPVIGSQFIKKNMDGLRANEAKNMRKYEFRDNYNQNHHEHEYEHDFDDIMSCASSDLFELENIGRVGVGVYDEELPVYGTTSFVMNKAIAGGGW